jgi:hypothetical protein
MNRKLMALGLALVASLALTAVMASAASAKFTSSTAHTILSGTQNSTHKFTPGSGFGAISCSIATFSGTTTATEEADQTIKPTYSGCKDSLGRTVDIDNESLTYTFTTNTNASGTSDVHVSGGMKLTVTNSSGTVVCTVTITSPQTDNGITYKNLGGTSGVEVTTEATNVQSTIEGGFFNCGTSTTTATAGTYTGSTIVKGTDTEGHAVAINVDVE